MAGSPAEERIRAKVVEALRRQLGASYRIIHELVVEQGGCRLDVAAVSEDELVVVEIKSEKDVLKRLAEQVRVSRKVAQKVWVAAAAKHLPAIQAMTESTLWYEVFGPMPMAHNYRRLAGPEHVRPVLRSEPNPAYFGDLNYCRILTEDDAGGLKLAPGIGYGERPARPQPGEMLKMLWAEELRGFTRRFGAGASTTRDQSMLLAIEHATGREIRRAVCAALRARSFPRADPPIYAAGHEPVPSIAQPDLYRSGVVAA